jgi:hypothetical protein
MTQKETVLLKGKSLIVRHGIKSFYVVTKVPHVFITLKTIVDALEKKVGQKNVRVASYVKEEKRWILNKMLFITKVIPPKMIKVRIRKDSWTLIFKVNKMAKASTKGASVETAILMNPGNQVSIIDKPQ